jgi:hypothetical protein
MDLVPKKTEYDRPSPIRNLLCFGLNRGLGRIPRFLYDNF